MKSKGLKVNIARQQFSVTPVLTCGTFDLQAKACLVAMTEHNGEFGCLTCEKPGQVVKKGRGHTRVYPYTENKDAVRSTHDIMQCGLKALGEGKAVRGVKGVSCLHALNWFNINCLWHWPRLYAWHITRGVQEDAGTYSITSLL